MSYLTKEAFKKLQKVQCFNITLPGGQVFQAREMNGSEHAKYWEANSKHENPYLRFIMLALLVFVDEDDPEKRLFDPDNKEDLETVSKLPRDVLESISDQYVEHVKLKGEKELLDAAKNSEATENADSSSGSVAS